VTGPDAATTASGHGRGQDGMTPAALLECWVWSMQGGPKVTFGGQPPRGDRAWRIAVWLAIAAEAARRAAEEECGHVLPPAVAERPA
jgi:hypothetical protein